MEDFSTAVERFIQSTKTGDFVTNLHTIYKQIQGSSADDLVATMHTLIAMEKANRAANFNTAKGVAMETQLQNMKQACSSRAAQIVYSDKQSGWIGPVFLGLNESDYDKADGRDSVAMAVSSMAK